MAVWGIMTFKEVERIGRHESNHSRTQETRIRRVGRYPEPELREGSVLVEAVAVGVCGTDVEIVEGKYGWAPPGKND